MLKFGVYPKKKYDKMYEIPWFLWNTLVLGYSINFKELPHL